MPITEKSEYTERFNMVMLPEERAMLQALSKASGLKESDVVRQMIRRNYADQFGKKRPGQPKAKYNSKVPRGLRNPNPKRSGPGAAQTARGPATRSNPHGNPKETTKDQR